eukprot:gene9167-11643_t
MTYPFVLSWSVLEAMACGALIIGSDTPPVREVIRTGHNGILVPFFDADALAEAVLGALSNPEASISMRAAARRTVERRFRLEDCLLRQRELMAAMTGRCVQEVRQSALGPRLGLKKLLLASDRDRAILQGSNVAHLVDYLAPDDGSFDMLKDSFPIAAVAFSDK